MTFVQLFQWKCHWICYCLPIDHTWTTVVFLDASWIRKNGKPRKFFSFYSVVFNHLSETFFRQYKGSETKNQGRIVLKWIEWKIRRCLFFILRRKCTDFDVSFQTAPDFLLLLITLPKIVLIKVTFSEIHISSIHFFSSLDAHTAV